MNDDSLNDDVSIEPDNTVEQGSDDIEYSEDDARDSVKALKARIKELEAESKANLDGWQRVKADYANAQKESEKMRSELVKYANQGFVEELLPALDAFDMAMANKENWEKVDKNWRSGVEYIYNQILKTIENFGVKVENPLGEKLDVMKHNPIGTVPTDDESKKGTIAEVLQKGYTMHGKEIRPASVKVFE
ncbi:MAG TPA: nucleotide exchange factor GrpE [Candidatus Paceibacterota bacterium]|nr:nucleotide exchange factor GrpE [Candidatus Paceibacterota bacterium]